MKGVLHRVEPIVAERNAGVVADVAVVRHLTRARDGALLSCECVSSDQVRVGSVASFGLSVFRSQSQIQATFVAPVR